MGKLCSSCNKKAHLAIRVNQIEKLALSNKFPFKKRNKKLIKGKNNNNLII